MDHTVNFYREARRKAEKVQEVLLGIHDAHDGTGERAVALGLMDTMDCLTSVIGNLTAYEELAAEETK